MDQVDRVLFDLKNKPYSRRIMTNIYVHQDLHEMNLYPCAYSMTFNVTKEPDKDKLVVSIRASVVTDEAGDVEGVELDVSDNGPGFTDQILEHAFEPYVTTKSSGTGLGLATIKKIAGEHGAMAAAENRKDADGNVCGARLIFVFHRLWHEQSRPN